MSYGYYDTDWYYDVDGDGITNALDIDDDGDGILDTNEPVGVNGSTDGSLGTQYLGTDTSGTSGTAAAGWDIYGYYGDSWYGGQPLEWDYGNYYPDYFGPESSTIQPNDYGAGYYGDEYSATF